MKTSKGRQLTAKMAIVMSDGIAKCFLNWGTVMSHITRLSPTCGNKDIISHTTVKINFWDFFFKELKIPLKHSTFQSYW